MGTIRDVAQTAGVSPATVSRYFNGRIRLPVETAARIEASIALHDYRPNALAKHLAAGRTYTIGLVAPEIRTLFFTDFLAGVEEEADRHGYALLTGSTHSDRAREIAALHRLRERRVDGLIMFVHGVPDDALRDLLTTQGQVVLVCVDEANVPAPVVTFENVEGASAATQHLIEAGHRAIAHLGGAPDLGRARQRLAGFRNAMNGAGLEVDDGFVRLGIDSRKAAEAAVLDLIASRGRPTALFAANDDATLGAAQALYAAGVRVPQDMSLVGFCGGQVCDLMQIVVTAARKPIEALGRSGCRLLLGLLRGESPEPVVRLPVDLVPGRTVGPPPGGA